MLDTSKLSNEVKYAIASNLGWRDDDDIEPYLMRIRRMTLSQAFNRYCTWHGIIGFSGILLDAIDELRNAEQEPEASA